MPLFVEDGIVLDFLKPDWWGQLWHLLGIKITLFTTLSLFSVLSPTPGYNSNDSIYCFGFPQARLAVLAPPGNCEDDNYAKHMSSSLGPQ